MRKGILKGIRVLDMSMGWAGPLVTMLLSDFGAEIIKVEARGHLDWWRASIKTPGSGEHPYEMSSIFNTVNRNKYGITLELTDTRCREIFMDLVRVSDIMVENFTPRVMKNLGLEYPTLRQVNPSLIMISIPAFGLSGPMRNYSGVGMTIDCMAGIASVTGYEGEAPRLQPNAYADPIGGLNGAIAAMMAIRHRSLTGQGRHVEVALLESAVHHAALPIMDYVMNGRIQPRRGNQSTFMAPHGCYRCKGDDEWAVIGVSSDQEWYALCEVMGRHDLIDDLRFADGLSRWYNRKALDVIVEEWTSSRDKYKVMKSLQESGVPAGAAFDSKEVLEDSHLNARGFFQVIDRAHVGKHPYPGTVMRFSKDRGSVFKAAPCLGEDNHFVLEDLLGLPREDVEELESEGVIGATPSL